MKRLIRLPMRLVIGLALLAFVLSLLVARNNAVALSTVDTTHVSAGAVVYKSLHTGTLVPWCSGILIAPQVVLTAGHCTDQLNEWLDTGLIQAAYVTFDADVTPSSSLVAVTDLITNPDYDVFDNGRDPDKPDLGVVLLATPVSLPLAALPTADLLTSLHLKPGTPVTAVGYGLQSNDVHGAPSPHYTLTDTWDRRSGTLAYRSLDRGLIHVTQLANQGNDNFCYYDSGGPDFVQINGREQLVAINVFINRSLTCEEQGYLQRLDTPQARAFLGQYVALP